MAMGGNGSGRARGGTAGIGGVSAPINKNKVQVTREQGKGTDGANGKGRTTGIDGATGQSTASGRCGQDKGGSTAMRFS